MANLGFRALKENKVFRGQQVHKAFKVHKGILDRWVHRARLVLKAQQDKMA